MDITAVKAYSESLERIYAPVELTHFPTRLFEVMEELFPDVIISLDEFDLITQAARESINRQPPGGAAWIARLKELVPVEHPCFPAVMAGHKGLTKISDFLSERQLARTSLYNDILKPMGVRHQLVLPLSVPNHVAGVTISRGSDFTDDELLLAQLLSRHIALAHVNAQNVTALRILRENPMPALESLVRLGLTPREAEVAQWLIEGKRDSEIADILRISPRSVNKHVQQILSKLNVETRTAAAMEALRRSRAQNVPML